METVNDLDSALVNFWRVLRDRPAAPAQACALTPHSRAEWESCADLDAGDELEQARRVWVRLSQGRSGRFYRAGWRHYVDPGNVGTACPSYLDWYVEEYLARWPRYSVVLPSRVVKPPDTALATEPTMTIAAIIQKST